MLQPLFTVLSQFIKRSQLLAALLLLGLLVQPVRAVEVQTQTRAKLMVFPAIAEVTVDRAGAAETIIAVQNATDNSLLVTTTFDRLEPQSGEHIDHQQILNASSWLSVDVGEFALQPGQKREVRIKVKAPADAEPGGHYATVYFSSLLPRESLAPNTAQLQARVASLMFLTVKGDRSVKARVMTPLSAPSWQEHGPVTMHYTIRNEGNVHTLAGGQIQIWQGTKKLDEINLDPAVVLPTSNREFEVTWSKPWQFGQYTAKLILSYGPDRNPLTSNVSFWVVPVKEGSFILLGIILLVLILIWARGRWYRAWRVLMSKDEDDGRSF
jgi:P pilus assembly chaperone PapD